jgi:hypothetical protein
MINVCLAMGQANAANLCRQKPLGRPSRPVDFGLPGVLPDCQWLVVFNEPPRGFLTDVPRARRIVLLTEPPEIKHYRRAYLEQFGTVISPMHQSGHSGTVIRCQSGLPWFYGSHLTVAALAALPAPAKTTAVSVVISRKTQTPLHRARLRFIEQLQNRLGARLHVYGSGFRPIADKREAIDPFKYHLALENNAREHFWTEKIADAYLGWSLPLYSGCSNMADYVPADALIRLDLDDIAASLDTVERCLDDDPYDGRLAAITAARQRILHDHNIFAILERVVLAVAPNCHGPQLERPAELYKNGTYDIASQLSRRIKSVFVVGRPDDVS